MKKKRTLTWCALLIIAVAFLCLWGIQQMIPQTNQNIEIDSDDTQNKENEQEENEQEENALEIIDDIQKSDSETEIIGTKQNSITIDKSSKEDDDKEESHKDDVENQDTDQEEAEQEKADEEVTPIELPFISAE